MNLGIRSAVLNGIRFSMRNIKHKQLYFLFQPSQPISRFLGQDRGKPIDRYYIEAFLEEHKQEIQGSCLEVQEDRYTTRLGNNVTSVDILDITDKNKKATIIADIKHMPQVAPEKYDCIILTQVLQYIDDLDSALQECKRILKPNGTLIITVPGISQRLDPAFRPEDDCWRFTTSSLTFYLQKYFSKDSLTVRSFGNILTAQAFLIGLSQEELTERQLSLYDPTYPCIVGAVVKKTA